MQHLSMAEINKRLRIREERIRDLEKIIEEKNREIETLKEELAARNNGAGAVEE
jgi:predicted RNase H-like nuclease (RuvC/YqgF family)